ncbi:MAG TPA: methyltransferase domain-containing protein [Stellaceae bacterium]|nr:methyltransferase domain-containing protein [Stellaceae bacterium]
MDTPQNTPPSPWVRRFLPLLRPKGRVLDLAAGGGRHTRLLREAGHRVVAVDRDVAGLSAQWASDSLCEITEMDLEDGGPWRLGGGYDAIVVTNYLHRPLLPALAPALTEGGVLIYATFMTGQERFGRPTNPDFLLRPGELLAAFMPLLAIVAFEQGEVRMPGPAMVQRLAAVNGEIGQLPQ